MSRIGKKAVPVPSGVTVKVEQDAVQVKGPKGQNSMKVPHGVSAKLQDGVGVLFSVEESTKQLKALHGLARSLCFNMIEGVTKGYQNALEIQGVGFRAKVEGKKLVVTLGFTNPIEFPIPEGIKIDVEEQVRIKISGVDKQLVGEVAARIRRFMPPEPYKGKGIRYQGEIVKKKAGKTVA